MSSSIRKSVKKTVNKIRGKDDGLSWEQLKRIEKRRRSILQRTELPFYKILLYWDGTVLQPLVKDPLMWITLALYIGVRIQARLGLPDFVADISAGDIGVIGAFLSFFLVFFVVQANTRFTALYGLSMSCEDRIFDIACICRAVMPQSNGLRLVRYLNAAHLAGYVGLSSTYTSENLFEGINQTTMLLTEEECNRLNGEIDMNVDGSSFRELVVWTMLDVQQAKDEELIQLRTAVQLRDSILKFRDSMEQLYEYDDQPISFFYVHFICLLSALYLPLFAVSSAFEAGTGDDVYWTADVVAGLVVFLQAVFVIGLRILGQKMIDPYGDDLEDLSVMHYVLSTWQKSNRILQGQKPPKLDAQKEASICRNRESLGDAWDDGQLRVLSSSLSCDDKDDMVEPVSASQRCKIQ